MNSLNGLITPSTSFCELVVTFRIGDALNTLWGYFHEALLRLIYSPRVINRVELSDVVISLNREITFPIATILALG